MTTRFFTTTPAAAAHAMLHALFGTPPAGQPAPAAPARAGHLARHQHEAVRQAEHMIARFGGTLIADPVGTGKTRIGATLAAATASAGRRTLVVIPTTLRRQWTAAMRAAGARRSATRTSLNITTHSDLSRDAGPDEEPPFQRIVIDEAHAFRNPDTRRYRVLARLARSAEVVLLTATPINNSLLDLYFLIRLFAGDGHFAELGVPDLEPLFRIAALTPDAPPPPALATVLRAITIRRTRAETGSTHLPPNTRFPERAAPHTVRYTSRPAHQHWIERAALAIESLHLAPYHLSTYGARGADTGAATLLRLTLAKRLESGNAAFCRSANDLCITLRDFAEALEKGLLRPPAGHGRGSGNGQLLLDELLLRPLPPHVDHGRLASDTAADLELLAGLLETGAQLDDPKAAALEHLLLRTLAGEQVLVFTEFRDTATDLWRRLRRHGGIALVHGNAAYLGGGQASRNDVIRRFAPRANQAPTPPPHEAVRILIATDVLSEGLNLQDAAHVVSYDLPWNPVRLLQRIGRIDRLGSHHHTVFSHHFLPDAGVERLLGLTDRLRHKLAAIRLGLGAEQEDASGRVRPTTEPDGPDTRSTVERLATGDASLFDDIERLDAAPFLADARLRRLHATAAVEPTASTLDEVGGTDGLAREGRGCPVAVATIRGELRGDSPAAVVALRWNGQTRLFECHDDGTAREAGPAAVTLLEQALRRPDERDMAGGSAPMGRDGCAEIPPSEEATGGTDAMLPPPGPIAHARRHIRAAARAAAGSPDAPAPRRRTSPAHRTLRLLRRSAARTPGGPAPDVCARIDRMTATLCRGLRAGQEAALQEVLDAARWAPPTDAAALCTLVEHALGSASPRMARPVVAAAARPVAVLVVTPR